MEWCLKDLTLYLVYGACGCVFVLLDPLTKIQLNLVEFIIFASYLDEVLVRNYTMGGFKKGKMAGTTMVPAYCKCLKLPEIQAFA